MGLAVATNISTIAVKAVSKVCSEIIQKSQISQSSSQIISVKNAGADVIIRGNKLTQKVNLNMMALLNAMSSEIAQQNLATELSQQTKALTSGLNLGQFSSASNTMNGLIEASIELLSKIGQTCSSTTDQFQSIVVESSVGNVTIENNVFDQVASIVQNCAENAVTNSSTIQDLTTKLSQTASATSEGLSPFAFVAIAAIIFGLPIVGGIVGGTVFMKFLFPIILIAGIVLIILYFVWTKKTISMTAYSTFVKNASACNAIESSSSTNYSSASAAAKNCSENSSCEAFDWKGINVNSNGTWSKLDNPQTTFFSSVDKNCQTLIGKDNVNMIRAPVLFSGKGAPSGTIPKGSVEGDVYVDEETTEWYQWDKSGQFQPKGMILMESFKRVFLSGKQPTNETRGENGDFYIFSNPINPQFFHVYHFDSNDSQKWVSQQRVPGPGMYPNAPETTNGSGFKIDEKTSWFLYAGIAATILGIVGTVFVFLKDSESK